MTRNNGEQVECHRINCYGVVKKYESRGVREPSDEIVQEEYTLTDKVKNKIRSLLGKEPASITWYECSVCHEYHPEVTE